MFESFICSDNIIIQEIKLSLFCFNFKFPKPLQIVLFDILYVQIESIRFTNHNLWKSKQNSSFFIIRIIFEIVRVLKLWESNSSQYLITLKNSFGVCNQIGSENIFDVKLLDWKGKNHELGLKELRGARNLNFSWKFYLIFFLFHLFNEWKWWCVGKACVCEGRGPRFESQRPPFCCFPHFLLSVYWA